jgi:hypothetical protein
MKKNKELKEIIMRLTVQLQERNKEIEHLKNALRCYVYANTNDKQSSSGK